MIDALYSEYFVNDIKLLEPEMFDYKVISNIVMVNSLTKESVSRSYLKARAYLRSTLLNGWA
jgi:hypothetical protein